MSASLEPCSGCGARFPRTEGPVHPYMESSPGCWAAYGELLAREYGGAGDHREAVKAWAESALAAWSVHRAVLERWATLIGIGN